MKIKVTAFALCFIIIFNSYKGVFIAQELNNSLAEIPLLPSNRQHPGIFHGQKSNITTSDTT